MTYDTRAMLSKIETVEAELRKMRRMLVKPRRKTWLYTATEAAYLKEQIDYEYASGELDFDTKRGIKAAITKNTEGWVPPYERV